MDQLSSRIVRFVTRQVNKVARSIPKDFLSHSNPHIFEDVPSYFYPLLINEKD